MKITEVTNYIEELAPLHYAQDFDNVGLLVGDSESTVKGVLVTLDCLEAVVDEAIAKNCNLIVAFHPIIFSGLKHLRATDYVRKTVIKAIKNDIAIYATHTALDMAHGGVSHRMARELDLKNVKTLITEKHLIKKLTVHVPIDHHDHLREQLFNAGAGELGNYSQCSFSVTGTGTFMGNEHSHPAVGTAGQREITQEKILEVTFLPHIEQKILTAMKKAHPYEEVSYSIQTIENSYEPIGMGAIGELNEALATQEFIALLKRVFKVKMIKSSLSRKRTIQKIAVLGGSGAFAIKNAIAAGADAYVTADLKYHDFFQGSETLLCDVGHYESEQFTKNLLQEYLSEKFSNFAILCAQTQTNPVNYL